MTISQMANTSAANWYNRAMAQQNRSAQKLAANKRILTAADDAAGISQLMTLKGHKVTAEQAINGLDAANEYANARSSALMQISDIATQLKELYAGGKDDNDATVKALQDEIDGILNMSFGDDALFKGNGSSNTPVAIGGVTFANSTLTKTMFTKANLDTASTGGVAVLTGELGTLGGQMRGIEARRKINEATVENLESAISRIEEVDVAKETINMNKAEIQAALASSIMGKQASSMKNILNMFA